ncbi:hypothetical protein [Telmatospirillum siberiense]|uniref:Uncharacterized protein n=1 Tax=Telmatospirillum siberiense TaxID=382514 RepID=A0A2N3PXB8_9PROT|nr:hypothetical protein [Telmatospirillum siberiense]PKU25050.1 hypothetical protein CWS72_07500 [Telmatospirillum siberiense]
MSPEIDKARLLRALAFEIRRKIPAGDALSTCIEREGRGGRHRLYRQASAVLESEGFVPALLAAGVVGEEAAVILDIVMATHDHRTLADAIGGLADFQDRQT